MRRLNLAWLKLAGVAALTHVVSHAAADVILHVDDSIAVPGNGLTWATGMNNLQMALTAAAAPGSGVTEIRVAQGTYTPTLRVNPVDPRSATFRLLDGVAIHGGYAGATGRDPDANDPTTFVTTLTGDLAGDDAPNSPPGGENAYHVLLFDAANGATSLIGLTIMRGNASVENEDTFTHLGGGILSVLGTVSMDTCTFVRNRAHYGGAHYNREGATTIGNCLFTDNSVVHEGGAVRGFEMTSFVVHDSHFAHNQAGLGSAIGGRDHPFTIERCTFESNSCTGGGGAVRVRALGNDPPGVIADCSFVGNQAAAGAGLTVFSDCAIRRCTFVNNSAHFGGGGVSIGDYIDAVLTECQFTDNSADEYFGGAVLTGATNLQLNNCAITGNTAPEGGGIYGAGQVQIVNCTITNNSGDGIRLSPPHGGLSMSNSIVWGNTPEQISVDDGKPPPPPEAGVGITVAFSAVEGETIYPGVGNTNLDPRMLQPACGNMRLRPDSPCLNAGLNAAVPPGTLLDLDGQPRIQDGTVDMGAYEGPHAPLPLVACADDIDIGDVINLVPAGGTLAPMLRPGARLIALQGSGSSAELEQTTAALHVGVGGYWEIADILRLNTTLPLGGHLTRLTIPFDASDLGLLGYSAIDMTFFDPALGRWNLAVAGNIFTSPGHSGPIGDRIIVVGTDSNYGMTDEFGDYGVFWNPVLQRGFAWANVDHHADFAIGAALGPCPADCAVPHDDIVGQSDLLAVLAAWGAAVAGQPADTNATFGVDVIDLLTVINRWGLCPPPP